MSDGVDARHLRRNGRVSRPERAHHPHAESREPQSLHPGSRVGDPGRRAQATPLRPKPELQGRRHQAGGVEAPSGGARLRGARRHHHELRGRPHAVGILADLRGVRDTADGRTRARGARSPGHRRHREAARTSSRSTPTRAARSGAADQGRGPLLPRGGGLAAAASTSPRTSTSETSRERSATTATPRTGPLVGSATWLVPAARSRRSRIVDQPNKDLRTGVKVGRPMRVEWVKVDDPDPRSGPGAVRDQAFAKGRRGSRARRARG